MAATALAGAEPESDHWYDVKELVDALQPRVDLYSQVMREHGLELPFRDESE